MRSDEQKPFDIDGLLEQAFPDDLPAEAEERMAGRLSRSRQEWQMTEKGTIARSPSPRRWSLALARISLVAVSAVVVILGLSLRPSGPPTGLASSLAALQKAASVSGQVGSDRALECTVRLEREEASSWFVIEWINPEETRVRVILSGKETLHTIRLRKVDRSLLELVARIGGKETGDQPPLAAELLPVEDLLTSSRFRRLLEGSWRPAGIERLDGCDWESFAISKTPGAAPSRVTVDTCTFLPVRLEKELGPGGMLEAVFRWAPRSGPGAISGTIPS